MRVLKLTAVAVVASTTAISAHAVPFFTGIGFAPGEPVSRAHGISPDGATIVGMAGSELGGFSTYWNEAEGIVYLGDSGDAHEHAAAASEDGSVIVGQNDGTAFRWTPDYLARDLGVLTGASGSAATDTSADGSVVVGHSGNEAFRWTDATGMVGLGTIGGEAESRAFAVSADGAFVVGSSGTPGGSSFAVRWNQDGVLEHLSHSGHGAFASDVSADGSVVVGRIDDQPFRWSDDVMVGLGLLAGDTEGAATAVSADGSVILGHSGATPFLWDAIAGMRDLRSVLTDDFGLDLTGWVLQEALGLSADGLVVTGWGINPDGRTEGWIASMRAVATVPEPSSLGLLATGIFLLARTRRRASAGTRRARTAGPHVLP